MAALSDRWAGVWLPQTSLDRNLDSFAQNQARPVHAKMAKAEQLTLSFNTTLQKPVSDNTEAAAIFIYSLRVRLIRSDHNMDGVEAKPLLINSLCENKGVWMRCRYLLWIIHQITARMCEMLRAWARPQRAEQRRSCWQKAHAVCGQSRQIHSWQEHKSCGRQRWHGRNLLPLLVCDCYVITAFAFMITFESQ